jgi:hypothetical protein
MNYYDAILGLIPLALLTLTGGLLLGGLALTMAVPIAASVSAGMIGHAMFVKAPVDAPVSAAVEAVADVPVGIDA